MEELGLPTPSTDVLAEAADNRVAESFPFEQLPKVIRLLILNRFAMGQLFSLQQVSKRWRKLAKILRNRRLDLKDGASAREVKQKLQALGLPQAFQDAMLYSWNYVWTLEKIREIRGMDREQCQNYSLTEFNYESEIPDGENRDYVPYHHMFLIALYEGLIDPSALQAEEIAASRLSLFSKHCFQAFRLKLMTFDQLIRIVRHPSGDGAWRLYYLFISENGIKAIKQGMVNVEKLAQGSYSISYLSDIPEYGANPSEQLKTKLLMTLCVVLIFAILGFMVGFFGGIGGAAPSLGKLLMSALIGTVSGGCAGGLLASSCFSFFKPRPANDALPNPVNHSGDNMELQPYVP